REDLRDVLMHRLRGDLQVADGVVGERLRVRLPDADRVRHELAHRRLEVVVADDAAGDAGRAGAHPALVEDEDVLAATEATAPQLAREVPRGGEPVDTRAHDHVPAVTWNHAARPFATACTIALEAIVFPYLPGSYRGQDRSASYPPGRRRAAGDRDPGRTGRRPGRAGHQRDRPAHRHQREHDLPDP